MTSRSHGFAEATIHAFSHGTPDSLPKLSLAEAMLPPQGDESLRPPDEARREIIGAMNQLVVCTTDRRILVDGGRDGEAVQEGLREKAIAPEEITDVLITHGDHDHILGLVRPDGKIRYPHARYALPQALWDAWHRDDPTSFYMPEQRDAARILLGLPDSQVACLEDCADVLPDVQSLPLPGHRPDHTGYRFGLGNELLYALGDLFIHPAFLEDLSRGFAHDADPQIANACRRSTLELVANTPCLLFSTHFPNHGLWRASVANGAYAWTPMP